MGSLFDQIPEASKDTAMEAVPGRRRQRDSGGDAAGSAERKGKTRGKQQNNRVVAQEEIDGLEKMDVEQLHTLVPVLTKMVLNLSMRTRQVEAVTLTTLIIGANTAPVVMARARVKAWTERAQEMRQRNKEDDIEKTLNTISCAALVGIIEGCESSGMAVGQKNAKDLVDLKKTIGEMPTKTAAEIFSLIKVQATFKETDARITVTKLEVLRPLYACLEQLGATVKNGVAPMSHLERILNTYLDDFQ